MEPRVHMLRPIPWLAVRLLRITIYFRMESRSLTSIPTLQFRVRAGGMSVG